MKPSARCMAGAAIEVPCKKENLNQIKRGFPEIFEKNGAKP
jgi:hypothetical protein